MMSSCLSVCRVGISFVMMNIFYKSAVDSLPELSPQKYFSTLQPGKASLAYFCQADSPGTSVFLEELNEAVKPLQDYGISVAKVNCVKEETSRYCGKEKDLMKAYLFRGNILLREFPTDTLFDANAIVAHVLFALLFNEVKYITTLEDLQNIENALKGKANVVFSYVRAIGTPEHRAVMEAAFVYGNTHQFVLTTEIALLESIGTEDIEYAHLYFFHCKAVLDLTQQCRRTLMERPLTTLNIHRFIKTMEAPLLTEVAEDPQQVSTVHLQLGLPLVFIVSQQATYEADRGTAEWVAWRLLGKAGVLLLLRDSLEVDIPQHANVVFKREEGVPVEFLVLHDIDLIISRVENNMHIEEVREDEDNDMEGPDIDIQDDEVAETIYRDRKRQLPLELTVELTEETFNATVMASDSIVLFYAGWQAVSMAFLQSYIDVAIKLKGTPTMLLTRVNCADWSGVCTKQNVTQFPVVKMYKEGRNPVSYAGMLGTEDLLKFIQLNRISCPVNITSVQEAEEYLSGELYKDLISYSSVSVLGLFSPTMTSAKEDFTEAGNYLKGCVITGIYSEEDVLILSNKYAATLPALLLARHKEGKTESIPLANTHVQDIVQIITNAFLETFPEITVENLPIYLRLQKPLLILFSDGSIIPRYKKTILTLVKEKHLDSLTPCWLNLKNTPVGRGILQVYFDALPPLPLLLVVNLHSGGQVFAFPSDQDVTEQNLLLWLKKLEAGLESHITILPAQEWKPPFPAYDFLSMMEAAASRRSTREGPECVKETDVQESHEEQHEDKPAIRDEPTETLRIKHWNRSNWFKEAEKSFRHDNKEL
ncbi:thioredoxin domain-containing protein 16 isoform X1 [Diceros bicornis minor]|uniref:thioredoxin domain-containing protein 16 isoform X1 n=1 Tax=Diceros bicornis minor TaxID=77932 RepID=UPI0026EB8415|nr:thioredoxin domain-containing protein 16 isoform X1 [Diceros bicornis minor]XP_058422896.1 thioredoxin domain-containing protein 16 isoform X1 [Diceros bicornis minor]XP_058422897.1 thioredoxin domain-containing protein 16 isoform X1 [Diceros bicornis minor]XP_058422898.1 thioredoxin domain-containing protein 16 isoform X1 [Diceros bicornis minor]XP_058422899.1 thioredoxin domain-containing protein 16 isoform X1 [Diceros bicornis minor]XP_058422900.1 thioredoxin domain-containing protein 16